MARRNGSEGDSITGAQCQYARNKLGLTQAQLAREVGVSRSQIANFETKGERFTPSVEVRKKLRDHFEEQDPDMADELAQMSGSASRDPDRDDAVSSRTMAYVRRLADAGCFRMSGELSEQQRDRLLAEIDKVRERMEEIAETVPKPGLFDPYDEGTDRLIDEADGLVKKFGFLCMVAFGYRFITLPTPAMVAGKKKPSSIADALGVKYADAFKLIGIRRNDASDREAVPENS